MHNIKKTVNCNYNKPKTLCISSYVSIFNYFNHLGWIKTSVFVNEHLFLLERNCANNYTGVPVPLSHFFLNILEVLKGLYSTVCKVVQSKIPLCKNGLAHMNLPLSQQSWFMNPWLSPWFCSNPPDFGVTCVSNGDCHNRSLLKLFITSMTPGEGYCFPIMQR